MVSSDKISQVFDLLFSMGDPQQRRSAIVVFESPSTAANIRDRHFPQTSRQAQEVLLQSRESNLGTFEQILAGYLKEKPVVRLEKDKPVQRRLAGSGVLPVATVEVTANTLNSLAKQPNVLAIMPNQSVQLIWPTKAIETLPDNTEIENRTTWGLQRLGIQDFWKKAGTRGKGIKVGVLDTGVYGDHATLAGKVKNFTILDPSGRLLTLADKQTFDTHRHGTHVCGIIAGGRTPDGIAIGVAPDVTLVVAQMHYGDRTFLSSVIDGITWAMGAGANVINLSIGVPYYDEKFDDLFNQLIERDVAPVVAIGNSAHGNTSSPGSSRFALGVGAVQISGSTVQVAPFSSGGSLDFPGVPPVHIIKPDVVAPGVGILSCVPPATKDSADEYRYMDGTSMASPHVAGVIAVLMAACPDKTVEEIFQAVRDTAIHPDGQSLRPDNRWGYGLINPIGALDSLRT